MEHPRTDQVSRIEDISCKVSLNLPSVQMKSSTNMYHKTNVKVDNYCTPLILSLAFVSSDTRYFAVGWAESFHPGIEMHLEILFGDSPKTHRNSSRRMLQSPVSLS
jgi:hypothetical protein